NITDIATANNEYLYRKAQTNGAQSNKFTITVDSGHSMKAGDIAYFWDYSQSRFIQREVTATGATTLTFSADSLDNDPSSPNYDEGGEVSVLDNALITNNFRIGIYRTKNTGSLFYLVEERPMGASAEYDDMADSALGAAYIEPAFPYSEPPPGRYLATYND